MEKPSKHKPVKRLGVSGCLGIVVALAILTAIGIFCAFPHPTHEQTRLQAVAAESARLMAMHPIGPAGPSVRIPRGEWPPAIAGLKPRSVTVRRGMVDITTKEFFDGGWGYGFAPHKRDLTMLVECWSELGHDVFWHGPC